MKGGRINKQAVSRTVTVVDGNTLFERADEGTRKTLLLAHDEKLTTWQIRRIILRLLVRYYLHAKNSHDFLLQPDPGGLC